MLTFGSLFAGIGGFDLGLERAGVQCLWQVEIDDFCQKVLAKHWPNVRRYGDVRECGKHNLETVDLICGGFPCQPHSVAGKRRGVADDRNLWPEYRRIIAELNPAWVVGENVPGIITTMLDEVLSDLEGAGYEVLPLVIPACALDAPHRRERVFMVAYSKSKRRPTKSEGLYRDASQKRAQADRCIKFISGGQTMAHASQLFRNGSHINREQLAPRITFESGNGSSKARQVNDWWTIEPAVGRVANGVPNRVDRLRALGNAVVPQIAEWIGRVIVEYEQLGREVERAEKGLKGDGLAEQSMEQDNV